MISKTDGKSIVKEAVRPRKQDDVGAHAPEDAIAIRIFLCCFVRDAWDVGCAKGFQQAVRLHWIQLQEIPHEPLNGNVAKRSFQNVLRLEA